LNKTERAREASKAWLKGGAQILGIAFGGEILKVGSALLSDGAELLEVYTVGEPWGAMDTFGELKTQAPMHYSHTSRKPILDWMQMALWSHDRCPLL